MAPAQTSVPWATVASGFESNAAKANHKVFRTPDQFANYWTMNFGTAGMPNSIDWTRSELVAIHLGHRGSSLYQARVLSVTRVGDDTVVSWFERLPPAKNVVRAHPSSPYVIISFPAQPGRVLFHGSIQDPDKPYATGDAYPRQTFLSGSHCLMAKETTAVITDSRSMAEFWAIAFGKATPPPSCDFTKWRLAAIFLGQRPTPGYAPVIERIARIGPREVQVVYSEIKPAPGTILPQVVTNPFVILKLPVTADEVSIERS